MVLIIVPVIFEVSEEEPEVLWTPVIHKKVPEGCRLSPVSNPQAALFHLLFDVM